MQRLRYVAVALVAGTVGAAVALLLAPDSGRNTRRKMARRLEREREMLARRGQRIMNEAGEYMEERLDDGRRLMAEAGEYVDDRVKEGRKAAAEATDQALEQGKRKLSRIVRG